MNNSIQKIKTTEECNILLKRANARKTDLEIKSYKKRRRYDSILKKRISIEDRTREVDEEISALQVTVQHLPEGQLKEDLKHRIVRLNHKKYMLGHAAKKNNWPGIITYQYRINSLEREVEVCDDLINQVTFQKQIISE